MSGMSEARQALWWQQSDEPGHVVCLLCPRHCDLKEGQHGFCYVRKNEGGQLVSLAYARPIALNVDPIEKKPLNHFLPGTSILSLGTAGCNMGCRYCQNWDLTKSRDDLRRTQALGPGAVVDLAVRHESPSIAFTYNEPTIWSEFVIEVSRAAHERGLRTVMVTNGYIDEQPLREVYAHINAANVDLKGYSEQFYQGMTLSHLQPVLDTLVRLKHETGTWVEITTLLIPGKNDDADETRRMCAWIVENLGPDVPLHLTAFHPDYKVRDIEATSGDALREARRIAMSEGMHFVYTGNVHDPKGQTTYCPNCEAALVERSWHSIGSVRIQHGKCGLCQTPIAGVWGSEY